MIGQEDTAILHGKVAKHQSSHPWRCPRKTGHSTQCSGLGDKFEFDDLGGFSNLYNSMKESAKFRHSLEMRV